MKRFRKNKFLVLVITVAVLSIVYVVVQNAIDNYNFGTNQDIVIAEEEEDSVKSETEPKSNISEEEVDLVLEESEEASEEVSTEEVMESEVEEVESIDKNDSDAEINKIYVHITGEVNQPGVVVLNEGNRIVDAINAAGGTTANADTSSINLVYVLEDGMKVNIPNKNEIKEDSSFEYVTQNSGDNSLNTDNETVSEAGSKNEEYKKKYSIVNINTATQTELETLPGIGPSLALKIINYRKENGKFSEISDIKNVSGIGETKFEDLKNYITI